MSEQLLDRRPSAVTADEHLKLTHALLVTAATVAGFTVSADQRVGERDAARLLGSAPAYLKTLRQEGKGPVSYQRGIGGCRISYRLADLAGWIESARDDR